MVSVCLPSDALLQHLPSYLGFSYLGRGVCLHGCSSKVQKCTGCNGPHRSVAKRSYPTSKEQWLHRPRRAERSYSTFKVRRGSCEEIPLVQGKILFRES